MAKLNINNIENVEGKYHLMFLEGKELVVNTKNDLRYAWLSLLFFVAMVLLFVIVSGIDLFYFGFLAVFLVVFIAMYAYLKVQKRKGVKQCIYAVQNSKSTDIVAKQIDNRKVGKVLIKSMSNSVDKYDEKQKKRNLVQKLQRRQKHKHLVGIINEFEEENKAKKA